MFIYDFKNWKMPDIEVFKRNINTEINLIEYGLSNQIDNKDKVLKAFVNLSIKTYLNITNISILSNFSESFTLINEIEQHLSNLQNILISLKTFVDSTNINFNSDNDRNEFLKDLQDILGNYYNTRYEVQPKILQKTKQFNELYEKMEKLDTNTIITPPPVAPKPDFTIKTYETKKPEIIEEQKIVSNSDISKADFQPKKDNDFAKLDDIEKEMGIKAPKKTDESLNENRLLLISERENKVFLPYSIPDLQDKMRENPDYKSFDEIIEDFYVIPLNKYKSPIIARFKEAFKLMKEKENASIFESLSYGFQLMNNYNLHPAVISACRNEDELDIYLDCLEENELEHFKFFDIQFDIPLSKI